MKTRLGGLCGGNHSIDSMDKKAHLSNVLWNVEGVMRHLANHSHPLHLTLSPTVSTCSCCWTRVVLDERVRLTYAQLSFTIFKVTCK